MELVEEYIHRDYTLAPAGVGDNDTDWVGYAIDIWQWMNYGISRVLFVMIVLVTTAILHEAHGSMLITGLFLLALFTIAAGEVYTLYLMLRRII